MKEDVLILYSGGADSRLMLEFALKRRMKPYGLLIEYGQLHKQELDLAGEILAKYDVPFHTVHVSYLNVNSGLTGDGNKNTTGDVHEMYVPGRNSIFLSLAFSVAEYRDIPLIWHGADYSDRINLFPDCYQEYFVAFNKMLKHAGPKDISVEAPMLGLTKEGIYELLHSYGVSESEYFSGYGDL